MEQINIENTWRWSISFFFFFSTFYPLLNYECVQNNYWINQIDIIFPCEATHHKSRLINKIVRDNEYVRRNGH